eukprot:CAMPEP_0206011454 /NCGR_PEP_ID=MMETSP1464-20131121/13241_1 /ASSEMBLY_ACC=CAM_ASM_001124 /TAXON_ID=119497 /ORGANISM="Exanthemachrysis gayraliae, Strain RCC1523" /LENGTH=264 /DNA_ID=CAMNT_0053385119 /DNA_START=20 /DNA_END=815 /DNA_ORIENTATION=+
MSGSDSEVDPRAIAGAIDPNVLAPLLNPRFDRPQPAGQQEYLEIPNFGNPNDPNFRRSWGERLTYNAGRAYLLGLVSGGSYGVYTGLRDSTGQLRRLRINAVLNATSRHGPTLGNQLGVVAMMYSGLESLACSLRDEDDVLNAVGAGSVTGVLYRMSAGPRAAAVGAVLGAGVMGTLSFASRQLGDSVGFLKNLVEEGARLPAEGCGRAGEEHAAAVEGAVGAGGRCVNGGPWIGHFALAPCRRDHARCSRVSELGKHAPLRGD